MSSFPKFRPSAIADLPALYQVCLQTGDVGADATGKFCDPAWLGHRFVGPYVILEPRFSWTLEDESGPCGYVLGTPNSERFALRFELEWMPQVGAELSDLVHRCPVALSPLESEQRCWFTDRRWVFPQPMECHPAHLHIDLLPRVQGRGLGRALISRLLEALAAVEVPGVHLGMHPDNHRALKFYQSLGFTELARLDGTLYLGRRLG